MVLTPLTAFVWAGNACLPDEKAAALAAAKGVLGGAGGTRQVVECREGDEPAEFWDAIGGQGVPSAMHQGTVAALNIEPR